MKRQPTFDIFLNYRRQDSRADAARIYDRLSAHFGDEHVFMDIDNIQPGENFVQILDHTLASCSVLLVLIGTDWLDAKNETGERRLEAANDFVRQEIMSAIERKITIIPVLVGHAAMPSQDELPSEIALLCQQQALEVADKHFHPDVDRLISVLEKKSGRSKVSRKFNPLVRQSLLTLIVLVLALGIYFGGEAFITRQALQKQVQLHLNVGDQLLEKQDFKEAVKEFEKARTIAPDSTESYLKITQANREHMLRGRFTGGSFYNIGLRKDYTGPFAPSNPQQISAALKIIYSVQELEPSLKNDPDLLLDEALILKTSGLRVKQAIPVLEKANHIAPENAEILAELGLIKVMLLQKHEGLEDIQQAIKINPEIARYHFYLAKALGEIFLCSYRGYKHFGSEYSESCVKAIKEYHIAIDIAGGDFWSRHIRYHSIIGSFDIFHKYSNNEKDIITKRLAMSVNECIEELEFLTPMEVGRRRNGWFDEPNYWLAVLYESKGQQEKASHLMSQLLKEDNYYSVPWMEYQVKLLQATGHDSDELIKIQGLLDKK